MLMLRIPDNSFIYMPFSTRGKRTFRDLVFERIRSLCIRKFVVKNTGELCYCHRDHDSTISKKAR